MSWVLVTGGAGFIGSHLCDYLIRTGHNVICVDNLGSGTLDNIKHLMKLKNFRFIEHDIIKPFDIKEDIDQIYHLASRASPKDFKEYPIEIALTNSIGAHNMIKLAIKKDATLLSTSTSEAYGEPKVHPQIEEYWGNVNPIGTRSCYDESKRFAEALMMAYYRKYAIKLKIVRLFNTYGPRMRKNDGRVIPNFITQCLANKPITIFGNGSQSRSFCYVEDIIDGIYKMMHSGWVGPKNLGNPNEIKIIELAKIIKKLTKSKSKFIYKELPEDDPTKRQPDIRKAMEMLDWHPKVKLEEGLKKTIEWFKNNNKH